MTPTIYSGLQISSVNMVNIVVFWLRMDYPTAGETTIQVPA